ncbi:MAG: hypothetical protein JRI72_01240 [Deltaproteobacteria bacterium]|nr:hypothetical protein [Deltaproteobacteria bacterium]
MIAALEGYILARWNDLFPEHENPNGLSFILMSNMSPHLEIVTFLIIPSGSSEPLLTAKVPRYVKDNDKMRQKAERVSRLKKELPVHLSSSFPVLVDVTEISGRLIILERSMPMPTIGLELKRGSRLNLIYDNIGELELIGDWLIDFFQATRQPVTTQNIVQLVLNLVHEYENRFLPPLPQRGWLEKMRLVLAQKKNIPYLGVRHTNLTPDHVSLNSGQLYIFNWENMEERGLPLFDAFHFITCLALYGVSKIDEAKDRLQTLFLVRGNENSAWTDWIKRVSNAIGIDEPTRRLLYLLYLTDRALNWTEFEIAENYWPQLFSSYVSWLEQIDFNLETKKKMP